MKTGISLDERQLFEAACELTESAARAAYLDEHCKDAVLRRRVEALLEVADNADFMNGPAGDSLESGRADSGTVAQRSFEPSLVIGRYKLLEQIGEGGFGVVYMAEQEEPVRRRVAVKIIKPGTDSKQVIGRFEAERQALAMLDHPNIAKVLDAGATNEGRPYFAMELVKGDRITDFCDIRRMDAKQRLELFVHVCNAIQHAHQKGIIHRDIKPGNVLVTLHDDRPVVKVIDFGVAKATEQPLTERTVFTEFRQLIGTPIYMSPEQATFSGLDIDTRSDVYSLGVLLYELLAGVPPFDERELRSKGLDQLCRVIRETVPRLPSSRVSTLGKLATTVSEKRNASVSALRNGLRGEVDWIVMKCLEKDRTRRYETANALATDIQRYLADQPVTAGRPSVFYKLRKFAQRHRTIVVATLFVGLSLLIGTGMATVGLLRAIESSRRESERANELRGHLYASEMSAAKQDFDRFATARVETTLRKQIPRPDETDLRGFEWRWLWNQCHREVFELTGGPVYDTRSGGAPSRDMRMSPDGKWLATGASGGYLRLWNMETKQHVWSDKGNWACTCVDFSPDSRLLLASFERDFGRIPSKTHLWRLASGVNVGPLAQTPVEIRVMERTAEQPCGTRFLPDGSGIVSDDGAEFDLAGKQTREPYIQPLPGTDEIWMRHYSSDWTLAASKDRVWDVVNGTLVKPFPKHTGHRDQGPFGIAISPIEPVRVVTASAEGIRVWNRDCDLIQQVTGYTNGPFGWLSFSRDGSRLAVRKFAGAVLLFETETWTQIDAIAVPGEDNSVLFSTRDDDIMIARGCNGVIRGYSISEDDVPDASFELASTINCLRFSLDGKLLATSAEDGTLKVWNVSEREVAFERQGESRPDKGATDLLAFSPDGQYLSVIGPANTLSVLQTDTWEVAFSATHPESHSRYWSTSFSPDGAGLYAADFFRAYTCDWPPSSKDLQLDLIGECYGVKILEPTASELLAAAGQETKIWSTTDWRTTFHRTSDVADWYGDSNELAFSPDERQLAIGSGNVIELFAVAGDSLGLEPTATMSHSSQIDHIDWNENGTRLAASDRGGTTRLWDVATGQSVAHFQGHASTFSPDGTILVVAQKAAIGVLVHRFFGELDSHVTG